jgi:hypothetical protein
LYQAQKVADAAAARKMLGSMTQIMTGKGSNPLSMAMQMTDQVTSVGTEMETLIQTNSCGSAGLKLFQTNLTHFANYSRVLDDLVADNARGWMMNRYQSGSITGVNVASRDAQGRPIKVTGQYSFTGMQGTQRAAVTVTFKNGSPDCMYFSDFPDTCRLPSQRVVSAYEKNTYTR